MNESSDNSKNYPHISGMVRGDKFFENFYNFCDSVLHQSLSEALHKHRQVITKKDITHRVLSHWDTEGLIECERNNDKGWRKFNFVESLWLFIVKELRQYGISIDIIRKVKECFFKEDTKKIYPLIEYYLGLAIKLKCPIFLIVFKNGHAECFDYEQYKVATSLNLLETHLVINLNHLLLKLNIKNYTGAKFPLDISANVEEYKTFEMIKNTEYNSATIIKKDNVIDRVEFKTEKQQKSKIVDLLNEGDNLDVIIKKRDDKILYISTTIIGKV